jgi:hypothetical protein
LETGLKFLVTEFLGLQDGESVLKSILLDWRTSHLEPSTGLTVRNGDDTYHLVSGLADGL